MRMGAGLRRVQPANLADISATVAAVSHAVGQTLDASLGPGGMRFWSPVVGWWFWSPRCVVGHLGSDGAVWTRVYKTSSCPPREA